MILTLFSGTDSCCGVINYYFINSLPTATYKIENIAQCTGTLQVNDSSMPLLGETQEEDRRIISDLIIAKMELLCKPVQTTFK